MKTYEYSAWTRNLIVFAFTFSAIGFTATSVIDRSLVDLAIAFGCYVVAVCLIE